MRPIVTDVSGVPPRFLVYESYESLARLSRSSADWLTSGPKFLCMGAINTTPKTPLLPQKHTIRCINCQHRSTRFLAHLTILPNLKILCFTMLFNRPVTHPQKCPFPWGHPYPGDACSLDPPHRAQRPKLHLDWFSRCWTARGRDSPYD